MSGLDTELYPWAHQRPFDTTETYANRSPALNGRSASRELPLKGVFIKPSCAECGVRRLCFGSATDECGAVPRQLLLRRGAVLFHAGERFASLYAIRSGSVKTFRTSAAGDVQITRFHLPGELIGMDAICSSDYPTTAVALEDTRLCAFRYERLRSLAERHGHLQAGLITIMSRELLSKADTQVLLNGVSAEQRVTRFLLDLFEHARRWRGAIDEIQLPMSREDIGNYLGLATETVSRMLTRLRDQDIVSIRGRRVRVLRPQEVVRLAS
jgi:CRP/FNR family transcriptional regulator, anaerobic regulatory protein